MNAPVLQRPSRHILYANGGIGLVHCDATVQVARFSTAAPNGSQLSTRPAARFLRIDLQDRLANASKGKLATIALVSTTAEGASLRDSRA